MVETSGSSAAHDSDKLERFLEGVMEEGLVLGGWWWRGLGRERSGGGSWTMSRVGSRPMRPHFPCFGFHLSCLSAMPSAAPAPSRLLADGVLAQDSAQVQQVWQLREGITTALRHRGESVWEA